MLISDNIAKFIEGMLEDCGGTLEIKRNDLAQRLGCVPSQINYVITSRFTPQRGYIIESRRGGGGYIRIVRKVFDANEYLAGIFNAIGESMDEGTAAALLSNLYDNSIITNREVRLITAASSQNALGSLKKDERECVRADIMRHFILALMQ